jgi:hypothetical protein
MDCIGMRGSHLSIFVGRGPLKGKQRYTTGRGCHKCVVMNGEERPPYIAFAVAGARTCLEALKQIKYLWLDPYAFCLGALNSDSRSQPWRLVFGVYMIEFPREAVVFVVSQGQNIVVGRSLQSDSYSHCDYRLFRCHPPGSKPGTQLVENLTMINCTHFWDQNMQCLSHSRSNVRARSKRSDCPCRALSRGRRTRYRHIDALTMACEA